MTIRDLIQAPPAPRFTIAAARREQLAHLSELVRRDCIVAWNGKDAWNVLTPCGFRFTVKAVTA